MGFGVGRDFGVGKYSAAGKGSVGIWWGRGADLAGLVGRQATP